MMADRLDLVALVGSLRAESWNRRVLEVAAASPPAGASLELVSLSAIPPYDQDLDDAGEPAGVVELKDRIAACDGVIINTPEYNLGISGVVKNALDWVSRPPFEGPLMRTAATVIAASPGRSEPARSAAQARMTTEICGAMMMDEPDLLLSRLAKRHSDPVGFDDDVRRVICDHVQRFAEFVAATLSAEQS